MAKVKLEKDEVEIKKPNIENLDSLAKEFLSGEMVPKKALMLKLRLVELWTAKIITEAEQRLLELILNREQRLGQIEDKHLETLNRIDAAKCVDKCVCKTADAPPVFQLTKDQMCLFRREDQQNIKKVKAGSHFQYVVFYEVTIPPEHQMTKELLLKEERGHHASAESYPKERKIMKRLQLDDSWFNKIFDVEEDLLSEKAVSEEYTF